MLFTTFNKLHKNHACTEGYQKLARSLGGVNKYGKDTPISLDKIHGIEWFTRHYLDIEGNNGIIREFTY